MNFALVSKLLSVVLLILGIAFALCIGVSFIMEDAIVGAASRFAFITSIGISLALALVLFLIGRNSSQKFFKKEALCTIGLSWLLTSLVGAIPYMILTPHIGISGAIFESSSGLTTTGASVLSNLEELPRSLMFWRCLSQWIGGMGVVVFFVAILGFLGANGKILYSNEASGFTADFEESRVQSSVLHLIYVYAALSSACVISYWLAGMDWYDSFCHMFATLSTGGFSTRSGSLADFNSPLIEWLAIIYMALGGVSFLLIIKTSQKKFHYIPRNTEFLAYWGIMITAIIAIAINIFVEDQTDSVSHAIRASAFQVVSIMTTTGFATEDFAVWPTLPQVTLLALMIIGGCSGSTAGGIKVARLVVAVRICILSIERSFRSRIVRHVKMNQRIMSDAAGNDIMVYLVLITLLCLVSIPMASVFEPTLKLDTNLSAVLACLFNIGPGLAEVGPTQNFAFFHPYTKLFLSLLMIMGRLELYAILVLFIPSVWKRFD
tara:strand:- start:577 stop:2052 length:1476 start_codon:yes stop_codon:yes gene_type:complete